MATTKTKKITEDQIIAAYMDYVLEQEEVPTNIYKFCKEAKIPETEFYKFFGSLENMDQRIWQKLLEASIKTIQKDKSYTSFSNREKIGALYYTLFENLTLNRSYILFTFSPLSHIQKWQTLKKMEQTFSEFVKPMFDKDYEKKDPRRHLKKITQPGTVKGLWSQFLFLLDFWMKDDSKGFEKTDVAIEKSVRAAFDVLDNTPLDSIIDFGKFLWKDRMTNA